MSDDAREQAWRVFWGGPPNGEMAESCRMSFVAGYEAAKQWPEIVEAAVARAEQAEAAALALREALEEAMSHHHFHDWLIGCNPHQVMLAAVLADTAAQAEAIIKRERLAAVNEFVASIDAVAEADMLAGNPITGAHNRAIRRVLAALEANS